jgi:hypothetical protein
LRLHLAQRVRTSHHATISSLDRFASMFLIPLIFVVLAIVLIALSTRARLQRRAAFAQSARDFAWRVIDEREERATIWQQLAAPAHLQDGVAGVRWMAIDNASGIAVTLIEHAYTVNDDESSVTTWVHGLACTSDIRGLPNLHVRDRRLLIDSSHANDPSNLATSDAAFDARFLVQSADAIATRTTLNAAVRAWLMQLPPKVALLTTPRGITLYERTKLSPMQMASRVRDLRVLPRLLAST